MKRVGRARAASVALVAIAVLGIATSAIGASNGVTTIRAGNLVVRAGGTISPSALPRDKLAPISLHAHGSVATSDGSHVPAAKSIEVDVDRHLHIDTTGLPSCTTAKLEADAPAQAMASCGKALVGRGKASAEVEFAESSPFSATGEVLAFNGPTVGGDPEQLDYLYVAVPAPTAVVVVGRFAKSSGRYGYRDTVTVPRIAGGAGSVSNFEFTLNRRWTYKGKQHSYLSAECPDGRFSNRVEAVFANGVKLGGTLVSVCEPKG